MLTTLWRRTARLNMPVLLVTSLLCLLGFILMYAAAGGSYDPYASRQVVRFVVGLGIVWLIAVSDIRLIFQNSYVLYAATLLLLGAVAFMGTTGMGAQRWLQLGPLTLQPSELAKIGLILALARFYHNNGSIQSNTLAGLGRAAVLILLPALLVLKQPDLGTALILLALGAGLMFVAGVSWKVFIAGITAGLASLPIAWQFLHDYQQKRVLTFFNPESDPLGSGYHIIQSKIAIGSSGFWGKGFLQGSQTQLQFLPEKHTDFVFALLTEDLGMAGALVLIGLYALLFGWGVFIAMRSHNVYASLVCVGVVMLIFLHAFINIAMVMGLMPVVGVPLPFISYGGSSLLTNLIGIGLILNAYVHRDVLLPSRAGLSQERVFLLPPPGTYS